MEESGSLNLDDELARRKDTFLKVNIFVFLILRFEKYLMIEI